MMNLKFIHIKFIVVLLILCTWTNGKTRYEKWLVQLWDLFFLEPITKQRSRYRSSDVLLFAASLILGGSLRSLPVLWSHSYGLAQVLSHTDRCLRQKEENNRKLCVGQFFPEYGGLVNLGSGAVHITKHVQYNDCVCELPSPFGENKFSWNFERITTGNSYNVPMLLQVILSQGLTNAVPVVLPNTPIHWFARRLLAAEVRWIYTDLIWAIFVAPPVVAEYFMRHTMF